MGSPAERTAASSFFLEDNLLRQRDRWTAFREAEWRYLRSNEYVEALRIANAELGRFWEPKGSLKWYTNRCKNRELATSRPKAVQRVIQGVSRVDFWWIFSDFRDIIW